MFGIFRKTQQAARPMSEAGSDRSAPYVDIWKRPSAGMSGIDDEILGARLAETVAWCDSIASSADLRPETLRPSLFHDGPEHLVVDLGQSRQLQLRARKAQVQHESPVVVTGRFMLYFPDENLSDGYAQLVSGGLFDVDNLPAYDTWVSFFTEQDHPQRSARRYLLCYVPAPLLDAADAGIEGNPESCIVWLEQSDVSIRRRVDALTRRAPLPTTAP